MLRPAGNAHAPPLPSPRCGARGGMRRRGRVARSVRNEHDDERAPCFAASRRAAFCAGVNPSGTVRTACLMGTPRNAVAAVAGRRKNGPRSGMHQGPNTAVRAVRCARARACAPLAVSRMRSSMKPVTCSGESSSVCSLCSTCTRISPLGPATVRNGHRLVWLAMSSYVLPSSALKSTMVLARLRTSCALAAVPANCHAPVPGQVRACAHLLRVRARRRRARAHCGCVRALPSRRRRRPG